ncbi:hypothetical protein K523DRAFT_387849 [Schizophyllum commune Tattone D]|nr:hypothetical protein K523DRAFT_387849 [Schizophyllum commune Tattone D]
MSNSQARRDFERSREFYAGLTRLMRNILDAHEANTQRFLASQANGGFEQPDSQKASSATQQSSHPEPPIVAPNAEGRAHSPAQDPPLPVSAPATRTLETPPRPEGAEVNMLYSKNDPCPIPPMRPTSAAGQPHDAHSRSDGSQQDVIPQGTLCGDGDSVTAATESPDRATLRMLKRPVIVSPELQTKAQVPVDDEVQSSNAATIGSAGSQIADLSYVEWGGSPKEATSSDCTEEVDGLGDSVQLSDSFVESDAHVQQVLAPGSAPACINGTGGDSKPRSEERASESNATSTTQPDVAAPGYRLVYTIARDRVDVQIDDKSSAELFDVSLAQLRAHIRAIMPTAEAPKMALSLRLLPTTSNSRAPMDVVLFALVQDNSLSFWQTMEVYMPQTVLSDAQVPSQASTPPPDHLFLNNLVYSGAKENVPFPWLLVDNLALYGIKTLSVQSAITPQDCVRLSRVGSILPSTEYRALKLTVLSITAELTEIEPDESVSRVCSLGISRVASSASLASLFGNGVIPYVGLRHLALDIRNFDDAVSDAWMPSRASLAALVTLQLNYLVEQESLAKHFLDRCPPTFTRDIQPLDENAWKLCGRCSIAFET